jgi:hypothetical protein
MKALLSIAVAFLVAATVSPAGGDASPAPAGYAWQMLPAINGRVLKPAGWFFSEIENSDGLGYLISEEDISDPKSFRTGLKVKYTVLDPAEGLTAPTAIARRIYEARKDRGQISELSIGKSGRFQILEFTHDEQVQDIDGAPWFHFVTAMFADDDRRLLIYVSFNCPRDVWPQKANFCATMLSDIVLFETPVGKETAEQATTGNAGESSLPSATPEARHP